MHTIFRYATTACQNVYFNMLSCHEQCQITVGLLKKLLNYASSAALVISGHYL